MPDPLELVRKATGSPSDAVRWACLLEATAPKPGNVYPGRSFGDLRYTDFVTAAELAANAFADSWQPISRRMLLAVEMCASQLQSNVNLGIVLLMGPLVAADEWLTGETPEPTVDGNTLDRKRTANLWAPAIESVLQRFDHTDGKNIYKAINHASAGGLGEVDTMDVRNENHSAVDIVQAMKLAAGRDAIARQYATGFTDLIDRIVPLLRESIDGRGDVMAGIVDAQLRMLAMEPDSLIARKNGWKVAVEVQQRAQSVDLSDPASISAFDESLRSHRNQLNPGTTADLIAAALYLLLRTPSQGVTR